MAPQFTSAAHLESLQQIVCLGGGTGLPVVLKGLAELARSRLEKTQELGITAIVAMSDDGGSSGALRRSRGLLPPGDVRNCLVALAEAPEVLTSLFQYRFEGAPDLAGHTVGNLLIAALAEMKGDFLEAVHLSARLLGTCGLVLPSTLVPVELVAWMSDGSEVVGEQNMVRSGKRVRRVSLRPSAPPPTQGVLEALGHARLIVLGPGSLYSSVLPPLLVDGIPKALARQRVPKVLVANLMTQPGETDGMSGEAHVRVLLEHAGPVVDVLLLNDAPLDERALRRYREQGSFPVRTDTRALADLGVLTVKADLIAPGDYLRHDPVKLARCLLQIAQGG